MGDFNFPDICWKYNTAEREQSQRFLECVEDNFLTQLVNEPTRESALLDLLLVNREGLVGNVEVGGCLGQSDNEIIEFSILAEARQGARRTATLDFRKADFGLFRSMVESVPWETVLKGIGSQEGWSYFKEELSKAQEKAIPRSHKTSQQGRRPAWINRGLWLDLREKRKVYNIWKRGLTLKTRGKVWREEDFPSVGEGWVRDHLAKLDIHKSMGPDGMHPRVMRELADVIAEPLSIIFEKYWRMGEVPEDWRKANITPVYKKGKKEDPGNYRPIIPTSVPGKIMELLILDVISKHIEDQDVIGSGQHGFTKESQEFQAWFRVTSNIGRTILSRLVLQKIV
ncbi:rna-directed dna polymerase from mobile element hypothetical protein [Limosa lapponica baueri]|uniref:Rna-directed dna polymerase from mobile element jockey-like n=1 Tax=Limosa lapponica baueri TaxID=1758121 RepID=A0A2I0U6G8_LIMLA|nr:rna-directed dna polymerase from mobile element hypothetical protein [Limosa lapponica baueri]